MTITTTLNRLKAAGACASRYEHLVRALGGVTVDHDAPINALTILAHNGAPDVEWLLNSTACIQDPAPAWAEYERVDAPALAEYWRARRASLIGPAKGD